MKKRHIIKKKNSKGFSMIELLAVVVILGVLSTIGIVSVTRLIESSKEHYYESQQSQLVLAARAYTGDHREELPRNIGEKKKIYLDTLYKKNYLKDKIVDKNNKECYPVDGTDEEGKSVKGSYVNVVKISQTEYSYKGYLYCKSCGQDGNCEEEMAIDPDKKPNITITLPNNKDNDLFNESKTIDIIYNANGNDAKISSYSYKIFVDKILKYNSGTRRNGKKPTIEVHEPVYKYLPGNVKIVATITNSDGEVKTVTKNQDYSDAAHPECGMVKYDIKNIMKTYDSKKTSEKTCGTNDYLWTNNTRHVWVVCNDKLGIGCAQTEFSKYLDTEGAKDTVSIRDNKNEPHNCGVMKCIDRTTPKITVKLYRSSAKGQKNGSAFKTFTVEPQKSIKTYKKDEKYNSWINGVDNKYGIIVEVSTTDVDVVPTAKSEIKTFSWFQNAKNQKENAIGATNLKVDINNNITEKTYTKEQRITDDGVRKQVIKVTDYAGNDTTYNLILKIDYTPPPVPTISTYLENNSTSKSTGTTYPNNTWKNKYVWANTTHPKDNPDVSGWRTNQYTTTGAHGKNTDKDGNDLHVIKEGTTKLKFRSIDNAGNYSDYTETKTIKLDRTDPVCKTKYTGGTSGSNGWYVGGTVKATGHCSDQKDLSGCKAETSHIQSVNSNSPNSKGTKKSITIYDNAGNDTTCSSTIKYDKSNPSCSIPDHGWTEGSVTITTKCSDNGPSGVASCKGSYSTSTTGKKTHTVKDNAGNSSSCSTTVYSKRQKQSCTSCKRCNKSACETYKQCTDADCCGTKKKWSSSKFCGRSKCCPSGYYAEVDQECSYNAGCENEPDGQCGKRGYYSTARIKTSGRLF